MENIQLENNLWMIKAFGELQPNILLISKRPMVYLGMELTKDNKLKSLLDISLNSSINLDGRLKGVLHGKYRVSKHGHNVFDLTKRGHLFVIVEWDEYDNSCRGNGDIRDDTPGILYYKKATSRILNVGYTYFIIPKKLL